MTVMDTPPDARADATAKAAAQAQQTKALHATSPIQASSSEALSEDANVAGVKVGNVTQVKPVGTRIEATVQLQRRYVPLPRDARAIVRAKTLLGETYLEITPGTKAAPRVKEGGWLLGFVWPAQNKEILDRLAKRKATVFGMDCVPRITRAQKMDTLSAMANIAGAAWLLRSPTGNRREVTTTRDNPE